MNRIKKISLFVLMFGMFSMVADGKSSFIGDNTYVAKAEASEKENQGVSLDELTYQFGNTKTAYSYPPDYTMPLSTFQYLYGDTVYAKNLHKTFNKWGGNCFGMCSASLMFHADDTDARLQDFSTKVVRVQDLKASDENIKLQLTLTKFIEEMHISQHDFSVQQTIVENSNKLHEICKIVDNAQKGQGMPVIICMYGLEGGHAVIGYELQDDQLYVYDPNFPNTRRSIQVVKNEKGTYDDWYYYLNDAFEWQTGEEGCWISYVPYQAYRQVWEERSSDRFASMNMLNISTDYAEIENEDGDTLATIEDGKLVTHANNIYQMHELTLEEEQSRNGVSLYLPPNAYTVKNLDRDADEFSVDVTQVNQGASVVTEADEITFDINDEERSSTASCNVAKGESYNLTLDSSFSDDNKSIEISGTGTGEGKVSVSQSDGQLDMENCELATVSINGQKTNSYNIKSSSSAGGKILFQGKRTAQMSSVSVIGGQNASYAMNADPGYVLKDVIVDGKSQGAVSGYCFENVTENHLIEAVFVKYEENFITVDSIGTKTHTGNAICPKVTVRMGNTILKENVDYKAIYQNNVKVGTAKISIIGIGNFKAMGKTVSFSIVPAKGEIYSVDGIKYTVTNTKKHLVSVSGVTSKHKKAVVIPNKVTIGSNHYRITKIDAKAFSGCSKVKCVTIKTTALTSVGTNAFKGISAKAIIKIPASKWKAYQKLLKNKGQKKTVQIKKG